MRTLHTRTNPNGCVYASDDYTVAADSPVGVMLRHAVTVTFTTASGTTETYTRIEDVA